jgi:hypothetical protein
MLSKEDYMKEKGESRIEKADYFGAFIGDYLNENLKLLGDIEDRKLWLGLEQDIYVIDSIYNNDHILCSIDPFNTLDGYVSDQICLIREKMNMLQQVLIKLRLDKCIKLKIDFDNWSNMPVKNEDYDPLTLPYKYFSTKTPVIKVDINLNLLPNTLMGYLNLNNVEVPTKDFEWIE